MNENKVEKKQDRNFQHIILTKFNVRVNYKNLSKSTVGLSPDWLEHRFQLFDRFCFPSVKEQSNQNFKWIVFFDAQTPEKFQHKVQEYTEWQNFIPVYVDRSIYPPGGLAKPVVLQHLNQNKDYLITTRIDNDDAISHDFVSIIQDNFSQQEFEFINFTYGYVWHQGKIYLRKYENNPFISLVEKIYRQKIDEIKTVYCVNHAQVSSEENVKQIDIAPSWLQVIHDKNVANRVRGIRQPINNLEKTFSLKTEITNQENSFFYWLDKADSLIKYYRELIQNYLRKRLRNWKII